MIKAKEYKWQDSNLALFGSETERQVKKESAETEEAWHGTGQKPELRIWRIEKFKVVPVPEDTYGSFFNGDSYIILNVYKENDKLLMDVHFWIGSESTQDEYGTAAYKTVELDTYHDDLPIQHREVMDNESDLFLSYFDKYGGIKILEGGIDSGFTHVGPKEYRPKLLRVEGNIRHQKVREVPLSADSLFSGDAFVLDAGLELYVWQGSGANPGEKLKAGQIADQLKSERGGKPNTTTFAEGGEPSEFWDALGGQGEVHEGAAPHEKPVGEKALWKLSDASGEMVFEDLGKVDRSLLDSDDVFILDTGIEVYCWVGSGASRDESRYAMRYAHKYACEHRPCASITIVPEGREPDYFNEAF
uniref:Gelsolin-like domain-containing protein n=1 Tax=Stereomyxa ramosa TaxID=1078864 RepID=A0A7S2EY48_9EUKA